MQKVFSVSNSNWDTKNGNNTMLPGRDIQGFQPQKLKKIGHLKNGKTIQIDIKKHKSIERSSNKTQKRSCKFCGMKFASIGNWKAHERIHTGNEKLDFRH